MKYEYYNPIDEKGSCVPRALSKSLNMDYNVVKEKIKILKNELNTDDIEIVFNTLLKRLNYIIDDTNNGKYITDINFEGNNIVFTHDDDWYHMICIINNTLYDKYDLEKLKNHIIVKVYKKVNE